MSTNTVSVPQYYRGREHSTTSTLQITNPDKLTEIVGVAAEATTDQALEAVAAAKEAFDDWAGITPHRRAELLLAAVETVMEDSETEAALLSAENGKVIGESTFDLMGLVQRTELACGLADEVES